MNRTLGFTGVLQCACRCWGGRLTITNGILCVCVRLCVCICVGVGVCLSLAVRPYTLFVYWPVHLCIYACMCTYACPYASDSVCLCVCASVCLSVGVSVCLCVYVSVYLSACLSVCLSVCHARVCSKLPAETLPVDPLLKGPYASIIIINSRTYTNTQTQKSKPVSIITV